MSASRDANYSVTDGGNNVNKYSPPVGIWFKYFVTDHLKRRLKSRRFCNTMEDTMDILTQQSRVQNYTYHMVKNRGNLHMGENGEMKPTLGEDGGAGLPFLLC